MQTARESDFATDEGQHNAAVVSELIVYDVRGGAAGTRLGKLVAILHPEGHMAGLSAYC